MNKQKGFTLIELLVVIAIIALLMSILMPAPNRVKGQARIVACQGRQKQWAVIFTMYTNDNNGSFHNRPFGNEYEKMWPHAVLNPGERRGCSSANSPPTDADGRYRRNQSSLTLPNRARRHTP